MVKIKTKTLFPFNKYITNKQSYIFVYFLFICTILWLNWVTGWFCMRTGLIVWLLVIYPNFTHPSCFSYYQTLCLQLYCIMLSKSCLYFSLTNETIIRSKEYPFSYTEKAFLFSLKVILTSFFSFKLPSFKLSSFYQGFVFFF